MDNTRTKELGAIDVVVTWVDGSDPDWLEEKSRYSGKTADINADASRFRKWDNFRYWFRAVEVNAPWVRKVHFVTWGHLPEWLDTSCPRLNIVHHEDIIPEKYRPTFSSHTIEWCMWRIPDLSEHFIYLNDDVFITRAVKPSDFFKKGLPRYCALAEPVIPSLGMGAHEHARFNSTGLINGSFNIRRVMLSRPFQWFRFGYKYCLLYNLHALILGRLTGMFYSHLGVPLKKSSMRRFCERFPEQIDATCSHRFRTNEDVMHQAVHMWDVLEGNFAPTGQRHFGRSFQVSAKNAAEVADAIMRGRYRMICINDHEGIPPEEFELIHSMTTEAFRTKYPNASAFELKE